MMEGGLQVDPSLIQLPRIMQFNESKTTSSKAPSASRILNRRRACVNCRKRKIGCDNKKPTCGQCLRSSGLTHECEYIGSGHETRTQVLEGIISRLETRIQELEIPDGGTPSIKVHHPLEGSQNQPHQFSILPKDIRFDDKSLIPSASAPTEPLHHRGSNTRAITRTQGMRESSSHSENLRMNDGNPEEPSAMIIKMLLDNFLPHASEFGFFLNIPRFREAASLPFPTGHHLRPSPALLSTVYLWGVHISRSGTVVAHEHAFLSHALQQTTDAISGTHPHNILHGIQAEILLSEYFFHSGKLLEGNYHASIAFSLSVSSNLHKVGTGSPLSPPAPNLVGTAEFKLLPPIDAIEEGERINAFWTVLILMNCWTAALGSPLTVPFGGYSQVDTPWPSDMEVYEQDPLFLSQGSGSAIENFLNDGPMRSVGDFSTIAMNAKASILFERASHLVAQCHRDMPAGEVDRLATAFASLDNLVNRFTASLTPIPQLAVTAPSAICTAVVTHTLAHVTTIHLHNSFTHARLRSREKRLLAAKAVIDIIGQVNLEEFTYINTIMGILWVTACQVIIDEISRFRSVRPSWAPDMSARQEEELVASLERGLAALGMFSFDCSLMSHQLTKIQEAYLAIG